MHKQGVLSFRYEPEPTTSGMTALAGLLPYLDLAVVSGLTNSIQRHLRVCALQEQGWTDTPIVMSLVLLNIAGGDCVDALSKKGPNYRFLAVRELLTQTELPGMEAQLPFPTMIFGEKQYSAYETLASLRLCIQQYCAFQQTVYIIGRSYLIGL
jgi:hypothetical protein